MYSVCCKGGFYCFGPYPPVFLFDGMVDEIRVKGFIERVMVGNFWEEEKTGNNSSSRAVGDNDCSKVGDRIGCRDDGSGRI